MVIPQPLNGYLLALYDLALVVNCNLAFIGDPGVPMSL